MLEGLTAVGFTAGVALGFTAGALGLLGGAGTAFSFLAVLAANRLLACGGGAGSSRACLGESTMRSHPGSVGLGSRCDPCKAFSLLAAGVPVRCFLAAGAPFCCSADAPAGALRLRDSEEGPLLGLGSAAWLTMLAM